MQTYHSLWLSMNPVASGPYNGELADKLVERRRRFIEDQFAFLLAYVDRAWNAYCDGCRDQTIPGSLNCVSHLTSHISDNLN